MALNNACLILKTIALWYLSSQKQRLEQAGESLMSTADISPTTVSHFPVLKCWSMLSLEGENLTCEACRVCWPHW